VKVASLSSTSPSGPALKCPCNATWFDPFVCLTLSLTFDYFFEYRVIKSIMLKNIALGLLAAQSVTATRFAMYIDQ
jgi:hypothetical protein